MRIFFPPEMIPTCVFQNFWLGFLILFKRRRDCRESHFLATFFTFSTLISVTILRQPFKKVHLFVSKLNRENSLIFALLANEKLRQFVPDEPVLPYNVGAYYIT